MILHHQKVMLDWKNNLDSNHLAEEYKKIVVDKAMQLMGKEKAKAKEEVQAKAMAKLKDLVKDLNEVKIKSMSKVRAMEER